MKLWNMIALITGISIFLELAGFRVGGIDKLFSIAGITVGSTIATSQSNSTLWNFVFGTGGILVLAGATSAIAIGTFIFNRDKAYIAIPIVTGIFISWLSALNSIINYGGQLGIFGTIIVIPMVIISVMFVVSAVEWFLGIDN